MPRLMRRMARTAVVVGTATATANAVSNHNAAKQASANEVYEEPVEQYAAPVEEVYTPDPEEDLTSQLERLGALKTQGLLTEEEYAAAKAKLLA